MVRLRRGKKKMDIPLPPKGVRKPKELIESSQETPLPPAPRRVVEPVPVEHLHHLKEEPELSNAPMFIKIDKYKDVVREIQKLKSYSLNLRDTLDALAEMEKELRNGLAMTMKSLDRFNTIIAMLDSKFVRFQDMGDGKLKQTAKPLEIDNYVKDLYDQMEKIRHELKTISV